MPARNGPVIVPAQLRARNRAQIAATGRKFACGLGRTDHRAEGGIAHSEGPEGGPMSVEAAGRGGHNSLRPELVAIGRYINVRGPNRRCINIGSLRCAGQVRMTAHTRVSRGVPRVLPDSSTSSAESRRHPFDWEGPATPKGMGAADPTEPITIPAAAEPAWSFDPPARPSWLDSGLRLRCHRAGGRVPETIGAPAQQLTMALMRSRHPDDGVRWTTTVPEQDFPMPLHRMPARPASGMVLQASAGRHLSEAIAPLTCASAPGPDLGERVVRQTTRIEITPDHQMRPPDHVGKAEYPGRNGQHDPRKAGRCQMLP